MHRSERKTSHTRETQPTLPGVEFATDDAGDLTSVNWVYKTWARCAFKIAALLSLASVSANTPETFKEYKWLFYATYLLDNIVALLFTAEMFTKMKIKGIIRPVSNNIESKRPHAYLRHFWGCFDTIMVICLWISITIQTFELLKVIKCDVPLESCKELIAFWQKYGLLSTLRSPRPLILTRVLRSFLKFRLPQTRVKAILHRSTHQVYNVTVFLLFFMSLYAILGVQFFGDDINHHCVLNSANESEIKMTDLAIPDSFCSPKNGSGYSCPQSMKCVKIANSIEDEGGYAGFGTFHFSFFTVYQAASQEGWVFIMYRAMDCLPQWKGVSYFISMIFFLAWLVKNVFIAILTETFAEIRVQFQQMWSPKNQTDADSSKIFQTDGQRWKLVPVYESKPHGLAPKLFQEIVLKSTAFNVIIMLLVLANAIVAAGLHFNHDDDSNEDPTTGFFYAELVFTILFNIEAIFKIWCLGWKSYWYRSLHKFEFILCLGTTAHCIKYRTQLTYFQVLRIFRLMKASPMLEDFCFKIFGSGKKLGILILFTSCLLIITSSVSLQLFCSIQIYEPNFDRFSNFPKAFLQIFTLVTEEGWIDVMTRAMIDAKKIPNDWAQKLFSTFSAIYFLLINLIFSFAFMSMFQILTQKGWVIVMHDTMDMAKHHGLNALVAIYFVFYHLFVTLIVLSLFVAVILDNLELEEDIKKLKQLKLREMSAETQQKLPMRLRIFEKFPNRPQMIKPARLLSDFLIPKIRDSFMRQFAQLPTLEEENESDEMIAAAVSGVGVSSLPRALSIEIKRQIRGLKGNDKLNAIIYLINESNKTRMIEQPIIYPTRSLLSTQHQIRTERRNLRNRLAATTMSINQKPRLNGEIRNMDFQTNRKNEEANHFDIKILQQKAEQAEIKRNQQVDDLRENHPYFDKPLFTIGRESQFRQLCRMLVEAQYKPDINSENPEKQTFYKLQKFFGLVTYLDWVMIIVTTGSCISMAFETPSARVMNTTNLKIAEYIFFVAMTIEMALKVLANGFIFTPKAVVRDFGGVLDFFIYIICIIFVAYMIRVDTIRSGSGKQVLMILRCLRPLRIFCLVPHMRRVVFELVRGFREILMVSVLLVVFMFTFAVYGVHIFGGKLAICNDLTKKTKKDCVGVFNRKISVTKLKLSGDSPSFLVPRVWANPRNFNFDNIGNAMLTLFEVLSLEGWVEIRDVIKARVGRINVIYIHLFVFIGCLIGLTLFVGVVIANYSENKGTALLTVDQRRWLDLKGRIKLTQPLHIPPRPKMRQDSAHNRTDNNAINENSFDNRVIKMRCWVYDLTQHIYFKRVSAIMVLINCIFLYFPWNNDEEYGIKRSKILASFNVTWTFIFCIECALKITALSFIGYWQSKRNIYDMVVTLLSLIWVFVHLSVQDHHSSRVMSNNFGWMTVLLRFFSIAGKHVTLKMLMQTVLMSMFKSLFVIIAMFLLMLVYALAGIILFGSVKYGENLGRHANFHNTFRSIALLFRIVTGEDWNKIMHDCMVQPPFCTYRENFWQSDCGNFQASLIYFCSFYIMITYIMLNVLVAIIMENFSLFYSNDEDAIISYNDIRNFQQAWNSIDVNRKGFIKAFYVRFLLRLIPKDRVGFDFTKKKDQQLFKEMCYEVELLRGGKDKEVSFHDVLTMLAYRSVDISKTLQLEELLAREELEYAIEEEVARQTIATWIERCIFRNRQKHGDLKFGLRESNEMVIPGFDDKKDGLGSDRSRKVSSGAYQNKFLSLPTLDGRQNSNDVSLPSSGISIGRLNDHLKNQPMGFKRRRSVKKNSSTNQTLTEVSEDELNEELNDVVPTQDPDLTPNQLPSLTDSHVPIENSISSRTENKHLTELVDADCHEVKSWWHVQINTDKSLLDNEDSSSYTSNDE